MSIRSSSSRRTPTHAAVSGKVAVASALLAKGGTSRPKRLGYQVWTAAWFLACRQVGLEPAQRVLDRPIAGAVEVLGVEEDEVDVARWDARPPVQRVPDAIADRAGGDVPVGRSDGPRRPQGAHER